MPDNLDITVNISPNYIPSGDPESEIQKLTVESPLAAADPGEPEVQLFTGFGNRSNVIAGGSPGTTEKITIGFDPDFDAGTLIDTDTQIVLTNFGQDTIAAGDGNSWSSQAATVAVDGATSTDWTYSVVGTDGDARGRLTYNGSTPIDATFGSISISYSIISADGVNSSLLFIIPVSTTGAGGETASYGSFAATVAGSPEVLPATSHNFGVLGNGDYIQFHVQSSRSDDRPFTYEINNITINTGDSLSAHYDFDIDTSGAHFPGSGGTIDIDCTNATGDGSGTMSGFLQGSWRTDAGELFSITQPTTATAIATSLFNEANTSLSSGITVSRGTGVGASFTQDDNGLVVRISSSNEGFSFWMSATSGDLAFSWDGDWGVLPTIYANGVEYPTVDTTSSSSGGTPPATGGSLHKATGFFPSTATTGLLAAQHLHDQIEATYSGVTVSNPVEVSAVGGIVDIDCTNAAGDDTSSISGYLQGSWRTDNRESFFIPQPVTPDSTAEELFSEANTSLRSDVTVQRGTGVGDSFVQADDGLVVRISSSDVGFDFWMTTGFAHDTFTWDSDWEVRPTIYDDGVEYPTVDTSSEDSGTLRFQAGAVDQVEITVDTGIEGDVSNASLVITENSGSNTAPIVFRVTDGIAGDPGVGTASTYTLTDPSGTQVGVFTSHVSDPSLSDAGDVTDQILALINDNTQTPVNFTATNLFQIITVTGQSNAPVEGVFSLAVDHHGQDNPGDITFFGSEATSGRSPQPADSGTITITDPAGTDVDVVVSGPATIDELTTTLRDAASFTGWTTSGTSDEIVFTNDALGPILGDFSVSSSGTFRTTPVITHEETRSGTLGGLIAFQITV